MRHVEWHEILETINFRTLGVLAQKEPDMAKKSTESTWSGIRTASDNFISKAVKEGVSDQGENHGFGADQLESLLGACEYTRLFRSAPLRKGYERSVKAVKNKPRGTWAHLSYLTTWKGLKAEYEKKEFSVPNVTLVDWEDVPSEHKARLRVVDKFPRIGSFKPVFLAVLHSQPEDKELFVAPKIAIVGSFRGQDGYAPLNEAGNPQMVMLMGAVKMTQDRYVRGTLEMALPPMSKTKVTQTVAKEAEVVATEEIPDFA